MPTCRSRLRSPNNHMNLCTHIRKSPMLCLQTIFPFTRLLLWRPCIGIWTPPLKGLVDQCAMKYENRPIATTNHFALLLLQTTSPSTGLVLGGYVPTCRGLLRSPSSHVNFVLTCVSRPCDTYKSLSFLRLRA